MKSATHWKLTAGIALLAACSVTAYGQTDTPPPGPPPGHMRGMPGPDREVARLTQILNLSPDQQKGVRTVLEQQAEQMHALRNKTSADAAASEAPDAQRAQMEQIRSESDIKIAALLDDNQKKAFADWTQKRKAMAERRRQDGSSAPQGATAPPPSPNM